MIMGMDMQRLNDLTTLRFTTMKGLSNGLYVLICFHLLWLEYGNTGSGGCMHQGSVGPAFTAFDYDFRLGRR